MTKSTGARIGYARILTVDQNTSLQQDGLEAAECERVFADVASGSLRERPELTKALDYLRPGDNLVVWRLDRLGRSLRDLIDRVEELNRRGIGVVSLHESIDTSTSGGRLILTPHLR
jgi:DNA invertase Pin-like site-specific DNA recombinase